MKKLQEILRLLGEVLGLVERTKDLVHTPSSTPGDPQAARQGAAAGAAAHRASKQEFELHTPKPK